MTGYRYKVEMEIEVFASSPEDAEEGMDMVEMEIDTRGGRDYRLLSFKAEKEDQP